MLIIVCAVVIVFTFVARPVLAPEFRFGHVTYQADNQIMFDIAEKPSIATFLGRHFEPQLQLKVRNWSDKKCDVSITSTKQSLRGVLNPNGTAGFEEIFFVQPDDYIQFTICGREQTFYNSYDEHLFENQEYKKYARISKRLRQLISSGDTSSEEFNDLYHSFGRDIPIHPHLYAFHYDILFNKDALYKPNDYIAGGLFDVAINERAKEKYNALSWTALKYDEVQELLQDPALGDLLKKVFE